MENYKMILEMIQDLMEMGTDTYMQTRYILLIVGSKHSRVKTLLEEIFRFTDTYRPLCIESKKEV